MPFNLFNLGVVRIETETCCMQSEHNLFVVGCVLLCSGDRDWKFDSPLFLIGEDPACVGLGKLCVPRAPPKETTSEILCQENSAKSPHKS